MLLPLQLLAGRRRNLSLRRTRRVGLSLAMSSLCQSTFCQSEERANDGEENKDLHRLRNLVLLRWSAFCSGEWLEQLFLLYGGISIYSQYRPIAKTLEFSIKTFVTFSNNVWPFPDHRKSQETGLFGLTHPDVPSHQSPPSSLDPTPNPHQHKSSCPPDLP